MSEKKSKARTQPTLDSVERAIRVARDEFERALVTEWDTNVDSAKIRNATQAQPYRCRHCGRPVAGMGELCACRGKVEYERFLSNPRNEFRKVFQQRCEGIATSASLANFVENIGLIAIANDRGLNWVEDEIQALLFSLKRAFRKWVIGICGDPFVHTGMLPEWFKEERETIPEVDLQRSLTTEDTEAEIVVLETEIEQCFTKAKEATLDQAGLQMAEAVRPAPKRVPARRARQDLIAGMVAVVKRGNLGTSIEEICQILDLRGCPLRSEDKRAGFKSWHAAWEDPRRRNCIKRVISHIQPAAPERNV